MKYKALRNCKFRAGMPKKVFDVRKGDIFEVIGGGIGKQYIGDTVEVVKGKEVK